MPAWATSIVVDDDEVSRSLNPIARPAAALLLLAAIIIAGCSSTPDEPEYVERPAEELYAEAERALGSRNWRDAAAAFEEVERQHPYSQLTTDAQLRAAYAYYEANAYDEAIAAAERFIDLHPGHQGTPYAYYLIAVSYYEQISDVGRDQEMTRRALDALDALIRRYPDTDYARDARLKLDLANDHLAGREMQIGRYYQRQQQYVAAINRFRAVVDNYQTTTHVPEALLRLTESYLALGLHAEAREAAAVLGYNFPGTRWYERAYALIEDPSLPAARGPRSWFSSLF
jgi:outer membrane protein assembly factor BamD